MSARRRWFGCGESLRVGAAAALAGLAAPAWGQPPLPGREGDPVVVTGAGLGSPGGMPGDWAAFRWRHAEGGWVQVPVQIDERRTIDYGRIYNFFSLGFSALVYADPSTFTGADPTATFDADDELAFMARDAGDRAPGGAGLPAGALAAGARRVRVDDPLTGSTGYVYLFPHDGSLDPAAGMDYVAYDFNLLSGNYKSTYRLFDGPNPEDSAAGSAYYAVHFADRWIRDRIHVLAGGAGGQDILDRHKNLFAPGDCVRSEDTFCDDEGAFICNIDGPVRAIRSYIGANSGPLTQRDHVFYERQERMSTFLRVHAIDGIMDLFDYAPDASGMTYSNSLNTGGVTVDGVPDSVAVGAITWEMVTGTQGSLVMPGWIETDIPGFAYTSFYSDDLTPPRTQCTGDAFEYATSGLWVNGAIPNTDPLLGSANVFVGRRVISYEGPGRTVDDALLRAAQAAAPLAVSAEPHNACGADYNADGTVNSLDFVAFLNDFNAADPDADFNGDGTLNTLDFIAFLNAFNAGC